MQRTSLVFNLVSILSFYAWISAACAQVGDVETLILSGENSSPYQETLTRYLNSKLSSSDPLATSGNLTQSPRIVGGSYASASNHPWIAALLISSIPNGRDAQFCGGTLVQPDLVITAAHCLAGIDMSSQIQVAIGVTDLRLLKSAQRIDVAGYLVHPGYVRDPIDNDIAMIRLAKSVSNQPMTIMDGTTMSTINTGKDMRVTGYGYLDGNTREKPNQLQSVAIPYGDQAACINTYSSYGLTVTNTQFCAGYTNASADSCFGDSGGPVTTVVGNTNYLTGIVSWGVGCAVQGFYGVYTDISVFNDNGFISSNLNSMYADNLVYLGSIGEDEAPQQFTAKVYNFSNSAYTFTSLTLNGGLNGHSLVAAPTNPCSNGGTLAAHSSCNIIVEFDPTSIISYGEKRDSITITSDAPTSPINVDLFARKLHNISASAAAALEASSLPWYSGGNSDSNTETWTAVSASGATNSNAVRSANINSSQASVLTTVINGPGILSFDWKLSTDFAGDAVLVTVDGFALDALFGNNNWRQSYLKLGPGQHRITWHMYVDAADTSATNDHAWLDNVYFSKNAWLTNKASNSSTFNPLGKGASQLWILLALFIMLRLFNRYEIRWLK